MEIEASFEKVKLTRTGRLVDRITRVQATIRPENLRAVGGPHAAFSRTNTSDRYIYDVLDGIENDGQGNAVDHRGHLIAGQLGGSGTDRNNIVPMNKDLNNGEYKKVEHLVTTSIRNLVDQYPGQAIEARITVYVEYPNSGTARPNAFIYKVEFFLDGKEQTQLKPIYTRFMCNE